jgi:hypothetical protein
MPSGTRHRQPRWRNQLKMTGVSTGVFDGCDPATVRRWCIARAARDDTKRAPHPPPIRSEYADAAPGGPYIQPVASADVAVAMAELAVRALRNAVIQMAGPGCGLVSLAARPSEITGGEP